MLRFSMPAKSREMPWWMAFIVTFLPLWVITVLKTEEITKLKSTTYIEVHGQNPRL